MYIAVPASSRISAPFTPISLTALESKAGMLERIDNKYVVGSEILQQAVPELARHFDILEIGGCRTFTYDTCYFDDDDCRSYFDHHQKRHKRMKVRIRNYIDAKLCFVEIKLKSTRGMTIKKRMKYDPAKFGILDQSALQFIRDTYSLQYKRDLHFKMKRNLDMTYKRMTFVAKQGGERMTLDNSLHFYRDGSENTVDPSLFIIEAKSAKGNGAADRILRRLHQHPTKHVSKYCTGLAALHDGVKHNNFRRALKKLGMLEAMGGEAGSVPQYASVTSMINSFETREPAAFSFDYAFA